MVPLSLALLPGFTDLMTAVNNDSAAVFALSLFLWGSLRLIRNEFSFVNFLWVSCAAALCFFTNNTAMVALLLWPVVIVLALFRHKLRWLAWTLLAICVILVLLFAVETDDARYWYRSTSQEEPTRIASDQTILGDYAIGLNTQAEVTPKWLVPLFQPLPTENGRALRNKVVTLGYWMWASQPVEATSPVLKTPSLSISQQVLLEQVPRFYTLRATLPDDADHTWVSLDPKPQSEQPVQIYYDGFVLAEGVRPFDDIPEFTSLDGAEGQWGGQHFVNLLRNGSAEQAGLRINQRVDNFIATFLPDNTHPSLVLTSLMDLSASGFLYEMTAVKLFQTFWGRFGWGHVPLLGFISTSDLAYRVLDIFTLLGILGAIVGGMRRLHRLPWDALSVLGLALLGAWGSTLVRGAIYIGVPRQYIPTARYAYPAIIPTMIVLAFGWLEIFNWVTSGWRYLLQKVSSNRNNINYFNCPHGLQRALYVAFFVLLDVAAIVSIDRFYKTL